LPTAYGPTPNARPTSRWVSPHISQTRASAPPAAPRSRVLREGAGASPCLPSPPGRPAGSPQTAAAVPSAVSVPQPLLQPEHPSAAASGGPPSGPPATGAPPPPSRVSLPLSRSPPSDSAYRRGAVDRRRPKCPSTAASTSPAWATWRASSSAGPGPRSMKVITRPSGLNRREKS
jgi:hypothetical protein